jgi:hypothetical protein
MNRLVAVGTGLAGILGAHTIVNARLLRRPGASVMVIKESVTVCVPARNEVDNIADCLRHILQSQGVPEMQVLVLDDGSTDGTGAILRELSQHDLRLTVLDGVEAPPPGWIGKPFATDQLRRAASGDVLVFVDADVRLERHAVAAGIAMLREHRFAMVCPYPKQIAVTFGERLVQPLLQWLWLTFLPLRLAEGLRPPSLVAANGQFMVIDAAVLDSIGGFGAVRGEVLDDVALGRAFKRAGYRVGVVDGTDLATCRMYDSWSALTEGYTKNLWSATASPVGALTIGGLLALVYLIPPAAGLVGIALKRPRLAVLGLVGYAFGVSGRLISARTTGAKPIDSLSHPLSVGALITLIARSWSLKRRGLLRWKGRAIVAEPSPVEREA